MKLDAGPSSSPASPNLARLRTARADERAGAGGAPTCSGGGAACGDGSSSACTAAPSTCCCSASPPRATSAGGSSTVASPFPGSGALERTNDSLARAAIDPGTASGMPKLVSKCCARLFIPPPYPAYFTERVFFLLCSASLDPSSVARHRRDNGLNSLESPQLIHTIQLPSQPLTNVP